MNSGTNIIWQDPWGFSSRVFAVIVAAYIISFIIYCIGSTFKKEKKGKKK